MTIQWNHKYMGLLLPILIIAALVTYPFIIVQMGETVYLETVPYDPTDLFRGDYVQLRYLINELDESYFHESVRVTEDDIYDHHLFYAVLKKEGEVHVVDYLTQERPHSELYLKCNVYMYRPYDSDPGTMERMPYALDVDYNINRFYLKEGTGLELEKASREGALVGELKVFKGKGVLVDIFPKSK